MSTKVCFDSYVLLAKLVIFSFLGIVLVSSYTTSSLLAQESSSAVQYTCPMHPEVISDKPGRCPICGMDLVPVKPHAHQSSSPSKNNNLMSPADKSSHEGHAVDTSTPARPPNKSDTKPQIYYCPMHTNYRSDKPGECPICHMTLVPLEETPSPESKLPGYSVVNLSPEKRQLIGLRLGTAEKTPVFRTIRTAGFLAFNENSLSTVNLKFNGWIEKLIVKATGESVRKGDPLLYIYSPELLEAKKNYVLALHSRLALAPNLGNESVVFAEQTLKSARERLFLWDITPEQIAELGDNKEPPARTAILSKVNGVITKRNVVEGSYVQAGTDLYEVADLATVWVYAEIYPSDIPFVAVGQEATVTLASFPNEPFKGTVLYIYPYLEQETHTVRIRFEINNSQGKLKPGDYALVLLKSPLGIQLAIDEQAVMDSGERQIVFVDRGNGQLEPREVKIGTRADSVATITQGLSEGERVVTSANFLVDSESRLKSALTQTETGEHHH